MEEEYKDVTGYKGRYRVSNIGNVFSVKRDKVLTPAKSVHGYLRLVLCKNGEQVNKSIHSLVAKEFIGACPEGCVINHIDGDKTNNCVDNLEYVSYSDNNLHAYNTGLAKSGESHYNSKLTDAEVHSIRVGLSNGEKINSLAEDYGVSRETISAIKHGRNWKEKKS
jgi:hypothetical protein